jgi:hypothetical protein
MAETKPTRPTRRSLAGDLFLCMETAREVAGQFKERHGRAPSEIELRIAAEMFGELQRSGGKRELRSSRDAGDQS